MYLWNILYIIYILIVGCIRSPPQWKNAANCQGGSWRRNYGINFLWVRGCIVSHCALNRKSYFQTATVMLLGFLISRALLHSTKKIPTTKSSNFVDFKNYIDIPKYFLVIRYFCARHRGPSFFRDIWRAGPTAPCLPPLRYEKSYLFIWYINIFVWYINIKVYFATKKNLHVTSKKKMNHFECNPLDHILQFSA